MKSFISAKGIIVLALLAVMTLGTGTALAGGQGGAASQESQTRLDGATITPLSNCMNNNTEVTVWGSGFSAGEMVILSVIKDASTAIIWSTGFANDAGVVSITKTLKTKPPSATSDIARWPGAGHFTLEATSVWGRIATAPVLFQNANCKGLLDNYPMP